VFQSGENRGEVGEMFGWSEVRKNRGRVEEILGTEGVEVTGEGRISTA